MPSGVFLLENPDSKLRHIYLSQHGSAPPPPPGAQQQATDWGYHTLFYWWQPTTPIKLLCTDTQVSVTFDYNPDNFGELLYRFLAFVIASSSLMTGRALALSVVYGLPRSPKTIPS